MIIQGNRMNQNKNLSMFQQITLIQKDDHAQLKIGNIDTLENAKHTTYVPLTTAEFFHACKSQPIVFTKNENEKGCGVLLGLQQETNLFLTAKNQWRAGEYIPFFIRQYPFIYVQTGEVMSLAYDAACKAMNTRKGEPVFDEQGEASEATKKILEMMDQYQSDMNMTRACVAKLDELNLLVPFNPEVRLGEEGFRFEGFHAVDEEKFKQLSDTIKLELMNNGMYNLIIAHLLSVSNFEKLAAYKLQA